MAASNSRVSISARVPAELAERLDARIQAEGRTKQAVIQDLLARELLADRPNHTGAVTPEVQVGDTDEVLDLHATADLLGISESALLDRIDHGGFPARRFGTEWRCYRNAVLDWLAGTDARQPRHNWLRAHQPA